MSELNELAETQLELSMTQAGIKEYQKRNFRLTNDLLVANELIQAQTHLIHTLELYNKELKDQYKELREIVNGLLDELGRLNAGA